MLSFSYFDHYERLLNSSASRRVLQQIFDLFADCRSSGRRVCFAGNGASSSISSHAALDLTKQGGLVSYTFSDAPLMSAFANDFGYSQALVELFKSYSLPNDVVFLVSTSGNSENVVNLARFAKSRGHLVVVFTGKDSNNDLNLLGDLVLWVDSSAYNIVENVHMIFLGFLIDSLVGSDVYDVA